MIRPEAKAFLTRWRDVFFGLIVVALGVYVIQRTFGLVELFGYAILGIGIVITYAGIQRARFRRKHMGVGVVHVIEGQITYFGPTSGGTVALSNLSAIFLDFDTPEKSWILCQPTEPDLVIPVSAKGAHGLFDIFTSLPMFPIDKMLSHLNQTGTGRIVIWTRADYDATILSIDGKVLH